MKEAVIKTLEIFDDVTKFIKPGTSEKEIATPTPWPTKTQFANINVPDLETQSIPLSTKLPQNNTPIVGFPNQTTQALTPINMPSSEINPSISTEAPLKPTQTSIEHPSYSINNGYKSSFYSIAYIRSAVGLELQKYDFQALLEYALIQNNSDLPNLRSAGLLPESAQNTATGTQQTITQVPTNTPLLPPTSVYAASDIYITSDKSGKREIYHVSQSTQQITLTPGKAESWAPIPDGKGNLYFTSNRSGKVEIYRLGDSGRIEKVTSTPGQAESWSPVPDSSGDLYFTSNRDGKVEIYKLIAGGHVVRVTYSPGFAESWSPAPYRNGTLYFTSNRDGKAEIYMLDGGIAERVTNTQGQAECWSPVPDDNGNLYFTSNLSGVTNVFVLARDILYYIQDENGSQSWSGTTNNGRTP